MSRIARLASLLSAAALLLIGATSAAPAQAPALPPIGEEEAIPGEAGEESLLADPMDLETEPEEEIVRKDLEVLHAAGRQEIHQPFSRENLGFDLPRFSAMKVVSITLDFSPQVLSQQENVRENAGEVQAEEGAFDTHLTGRLGPSYRQTDRDMRARPNDGPSTSYPNPLRRRESVVDYEIGLRKRLANGVVINPKVGFTQSVNRDYSDQFSNDNRGLFEFDITIPLGKGGGTLVNKAPEIAARFDLLASALQLRHVTSDSVRSVLRAYWACKAAEEIYKLRVESEAVASKLLSVGRSLADGDELAPSELPQAIADRDSATANRIRAEVDLIAARQALATAMGFAPSSLLLSPLPADDFPSPPRREANPDVKSLISTALALRDDLRAVAQVEKSRKVLMDASFLELRPTINLDLRASHSPFETRDNLRIENGNAWRAEAALQLDWPLENNTAIGDYVRSTAVYRNSQISVSDKERTIVSEVIVAAAAVKGASTNVRLFGESARWYGEALRSQEQLFALGQGSLTDTITARERLVNAQLQFVRAREEYANALVQLRFATGTLFFADNAGSWIDENVWNQVPFSESGEQ